MCYCQDKFLSLSYFAVVLEKIRRYFDYKRTYGMKIYDYNGKKNICGDRIHEARCKLRLTQENLAAKLQLNGIILERDSISRIEIGTRFVADYELREFAKILDVSVGWLLDME